MSEGTVFQRADGRWCAKWKDAHGNWRCLYRKGSAEAKQALRAALEDGDEGITPASKMAVAALLEEWLEDTNGTVSYRIRVNHRGIVRPHLEPAIGSKRLARVTPRDVHDLHQPAVQVIIAEKQKKHDGLSKWPTCARRSTAESSSCIRISSKSAGRRPPSATPGSLSALNSAPRG